MLTLTPLFVFLFIEKVAARGRALFRLFQHPSLTIVKGAGLIMKALIEEGETEIGVKMQVKESVLTDSILRV